MSVPAPNGPKWRSSPFSKASPHSSPVPAPAGRDRPQSMNMSSPLTSPLAGRHSRTKSTFSQLDKFQSLERSDSSRQRSNSYRSSAHGSGTFAPKFIKSEEMQRPMPRVDGIEGEIDFSGKRYVWLRDPATTFMKGWVVEELPDGYLRIQCDDGSV